MDSIFRIALVAQPRCHASQPLARSQIQRFGMAVDDPASERRRVRQAELEEGFHSVGIRLGIAPD
ncbi:hypothetical protein [Variovorax saccharolyticus]|uniref:hypothetical protein n=1 Tax=Variovorax saccharolyticus TaxID=3053516 RepID=UPI002577023B|nr:hypothetical protein [Variovorax sp. J22R187]MDM0022159.1 hypothetical protein [Variovorax sp. J22R187]